MTLNQYMAFFSLIMACNFEPESSLEKSFKILLIVMFFVFNHLSFMEFWKGMMK